VGSKSIWAKIENIGPANTTLNRFQAHELCGLYYAKTHFVTFFLCAMSAAMWQGLRFCDNKPMSYACDMNQTNVT